MSKFREREVSRRERWRDMGRRATGEKGVVAGKQLWLVKRLQCEEEGLFLKGRAA